MKVYLTEPEHYLYDEILDFPPKNVEYTRRKLEFKDIIDIDSLQAALYLKNKLSNNINTHIISSSDSFDIIQSNGSIIHNSSKPWIVDFEDGTAFTFLKNPTEKEKQKVTELLESEECKKLMPHCEAAKKSFYNIYNPSKTIKQKTEVIYPAFHTPENYNTETDKTSLLFVAREFERKGGYEAFRAFKQLQREFDNLEFICVSDVPEEVKKQQVENTRFHSDVQRETLYDLYREADIFVYPTFHDTFGLVMLEAMAYGNPVITLEAFATPEIIEDGEDGFLIDGYEEKWFNPESKVRIDKFNDWRELRKRHRKAEKKRIVSDISDKCSEIIENKELHNKLSENAREKIRKGKFSINRRNQKLSNIYHDSICD